VNIYGWRHSASEGNTVKLKWATTSMVCRSKGLKNLARPGTWENLDISTDGILFVKNQLLEESFCYVSHVWHKKIVAFEVPHHFKIYVDTGFKAIKLFIAIYI
jgi:hypothetical protein